MYTMMGVCDQEICAWDAEGDQILVKDTTRFAKEMCPKVFRHQNFQAFRRFLKMYQGRVIPPPAPAPRPPPFTEAF